MELVISLPFPTLLLTSAAIGITWIAWQALYNVYFHPLARFPGPRLAAATRYWKAWVECVQEKSFTHELEKLHARYGKVVRVGPNEASRQCVMIWEHLEMHATAGTRILASTEASPKTSPRSDTSTTTPQSSGETSSASRFRQQPCRSARSSWSTRLGSSALPWRLVAKLARLCFGTTVNALAEPEFRSPFLVAVDASVPIGLRFKHFPLYRALILAVAPVLSKVVSNPEMAGMVHLHKLLYSQVRDVMKDPKRALESLPHGMTIYHRLMDPATYPDGEAPPGEKSLWEEAQSLLFGGSETVGWALTIGTFHLLKNPEKLRILTDELTTAWSGKNKAPGLKELERLPYLDAVIKETLRLSFGVVAGLPRVVPQEGATISGERIPGGTVVSMGSFFVHRNADIFPSPYSFKPERWLDEPGLENWFVPFARGPRMCLGLTLGWAELRLTFAHVIHRFGNDMKLAASSPSELTFRDMFMPRWLGERVKVEISPKD